MAILLDQDIGFNGNSTTTITVSGTFPAGALILVIVGFGTATSGQSLSQSGNTFTTIVTRENTATNNLVYYFGYIANWSGGALSTTFTLSGTGKDAGARLLSFTGIKTVSPLLVSKDAGGAPNSATFDSGAASGTVPGNSLVVGAFSYANSATRTFSNPTGGPTYGWTLTATSNGSSANTPHGHAHFSWSILNGGPLPQPEAIVTASGTASYSATVAVFQEDFNPFQDAGAQLLQWAEWGAGAASGGTLTGAATGQYTTTDAVLSDGATGAQYTTADTVDAVTIVPISATGQYTTTDAVLSNGEVGGQHTYAGPELAGSFVSGQYTTADSVTAQVSGGGQLPVSATGQYTTSDGLLASSSIAGQAATSDSVTPLTLVIGAIVGQETYNGAVLSSGAISSLLVYAGVLNGIAQGALITPVGTIAAGSTPAGSLDTGLAPAGSIQPGTVPGGTIQAGSAPSGTIAAGQEPSGTIARD